MGSSSLLSTMAGSAADKELLLKRLAVILDVGDEDTDYVTDVLDQLIEIGEDVADVASYLTSFLGGDDDADDNSDLAEFANDVRRFKLGEDIIIEEKTTAGSSPKGDAKQQQDTTHHRQLQQQRKTEEDQKKQQPVRQQLTAKPVSAANPAKNVMKSSEIAEKPKSDKVQKGSSKQAKNAYPSAATKDPPTQQGSTSTTKQQKKPPPPKELKKGKAKRICGCFGTKHKPLTNCLHCGRISCEVEGYDFCPYCHILIEDFSQRIRGDRTSSSALLHKERLLEFDRTAAARTHILDDQEDYFVSSTSMWSTQEEQNNARDKEEERRKLLHERQKQTLAINF